jgi:hypothetical protein
MLDSMIDPTEDEEFEIDPDYELEKQIEREERKLEEYQNNI